MTEAVVEMQGIHTIFGTDVVHRDIDLSVRRGEILGLVGGSGSGKTTLMREMIGLLRPSRGSVSVFGQRLDKVDSRTLNQLRKRWGILFQRGALFTALSVFDNIALPLRELRLLEERVISRLVCLKLKMVGLAARDGRRAPAELSGGMIKRVGLARALALEPELLLLDEPTSGLDPIASEGFVDLIGTLRNELGLTVVLVTHDLHTLADLCDRVAVLADGQLVAMGPLSDVMTVDHPFIAEYFGGKRGQRVVLASPRH